MTENVRLQNLRDFTVQIRNANDQIVGTGIAVSTDGKIVTCAHVVEAAGVASAQCKRRGSWCLFSTSTWRGREETSRNC